MPTQKKPPAQRPPRKQPADSSESTKAVPAPAQREPAPGMPAADSVISEAPFQAPTGKTYRILKTNETDEYDRPKDPKDAPSGSERAVPPPDRPVLRTQQAQASQDFGDDAKRAAELRRKALDDARAMPMSDEEKPPTKSP